MIEAKVTETQETQSNPTPAVITVSGVINDLDNGIDRDGIATKYGLTKAEVKIMFQHPALKGKRVKKNKVKELRFKLVDDVTPQTDPAQTSIEDYIHTQETVTESMDSVSENANDTDFDNYLNS